MSIGKTTQEVVAVSSDIPVQVIVAAFQDEYGADAALAQLKQAGKEHLIDIDQAIVVRKDAGGKVHIKRARGVGAGSGALIGGVTGAVVSILAGPVGWMAGIGAVIGALGGQLNKSHSSPNLDKLAGALKPGTSAIVAVIEHTWVAELDRELAQAGAQVVTDAISQDIAAQLEAGKDVAYTAVSGAGGVAAGRVAGDATSVEAEGIVATDQGVAAGEVVVATEADASAPTSPPPASAAGGEASKPA
jgi:uncharacterized membrane protein